MIRQLVRLGVELGVGDCTAFEHYCRLIGHSRRLLFDQRMNTDLGRGIGSRIVEFHHYTGSLGLT